MRRDMKRPGKAARRKIEGRSRKEESPNGLRGLLREIPQVEKVLFTEPIEGGAAIVVTPGQLGGTRHISAAQFAQDRRDAVALVASTDGHFTLFAWSPRAGMVHAHRVEALLL